MKTILLWSLGIVFTGAVLVPTDEPLVGYRIDRPWLPGACWQYVHADPPAATWRVVDVGPLEVSSLLDVDTLTMQRHGTMDLMAKRVPCNKEAS